MRNNLLLLHFFSIFLNPQRVTLTYSAMTDGPIDVQLRWANLRAREHHVKGPKKSPRKMVLRRLILRKAEEAKRTTTWAPYRVQCPCLQCQNQPRWILLNFPSVDMGTLSKTVGFSLYPSHWVYRVKLKVTLFGSSIFFAIIYLPYLDSKHMGFLVQYTWSLPFPHFQKRKHIIFL